MRAIGALSAAADPLLLGRALESRLDRLRGCWIMLPMKTTLSLPLEDLGRSGAVKRAVSTP